MFYEYVALLALICAAAAQQQHHRYRQPQEVLLELKQIEHHKQIFNKNPHLREKHEYITTAKNILEAANTTANISEKCSMQSRYLLDSIPSTWALTVFDAWAKPETGLLRFNFRWIGNYDECISVKSEYNSTWQSSDLSYSGKYCTVNLKESIVNQGKVTDVPIAFGVCVPDGCSGQDVAHLVNSVWVDVLRNSNHATASCQEKNVPLTSGAIATLVVFGILITLAFFSTLFDYFSQWWARKQVIHTLAVNDHTPSANGSANGEIHTVAEYTPLLAKSEAKKVDLSQGSFVKFLLCFSLYTNGCKLLGANQPAGSLHCVHGIRFLSMTWVILGHTIVICMAGIGNLYNVFPVWLKRQSFQAVYNATVSVDSFFLLSGLLTTYLFLRNFEKMNTTVIEFFKSVPVMYLHRYIRLTPPYGLMIMFHTCITFYLVDGPDAGTDTTFDENCKDRWFLNLLYVNNIIDGDSNKQCAGWGWYLANDFQFFLVAPFVIYLMYRMEPAGVALATAMVITSCGAATGVSAQKHLTLAISQDPHWFSVYYGAPWVRYQSFGVGLLFGYALWKCNGQFKIPIWLNLSLWAASALLCLLPVYGPYDGETGGHVPSNAEAAIYNGWARTSWAVGLGWVVFACCTENGGWIDEFLSWRGFVPLSRMTYCAYLVHPVVMLIVTSWYRKLLDITIIAFIGNFAMYVVLAYGVAFVFSLLTEAPFMNLDKHFISGKLSDNKKKQ